MIAPMVPKPGPNMSVPPSSVVSVVFPIASPLPLALLPLVVFLEPLAVVVVVCVAVGVFVNVGVKVGVEVAVTVDVSASVTVVDGGLSVAGAVGVGVSEAVLPRVYSVYEIFEFDKGAPIFT